MKRKAMKYNAIKALTYLLMALILLALICYLLVALVDAFIESKYFASCICSLAIIYNFVIIIQLVGMSRARLKDILRLQNVLKGE